MRNFKIEILSSKDVAISWENIGATKSRSHIEEMESLVETISIRKKNFRKKIHS